jgi:cell division protease FtsH
MVCNWGMSDELGPVTFGKKEEHIFLGREFAQSKDFSEDTARLIDAAIKNLVLKASGQALALLSKHRGQLETLAQGLLEKETLDSREIDKILAVVEQPQEEASEPQEESRDPDQFPLSQRA